MKRLTILALVALSTLAASTAHAGGAREFAEKGQLIFSADRLFPLFSYSRTSVSQTLNGTENKQVESGASMSFFLGQEPAAATFATVPRLAFDYAVINHLTVGGSVVLAFGLSATNKIESSNNNGGSTSNETDAPKTTIIGFAPRAGYFFDFTDTIGFWPRLGFTYVSQSTSQERDNGNGGKVTDKTHDSVFALNVEPMFVLSPFRNVFFLAGPVLDVSLTGGRTVETGNTKNEPNLSVLHFGIETGLGVNF